jgi:hypothetical protein
MRSDRTPNAPTGDLTTIDAWQTGEMTYAELVADWRPLPVVVGDRENGTATAPTVPSTADMTRDEVEEELAYLATVEHALCVEYLFAHYSMNAPLVLPENASGAQTRIHTAAHTVFTIAVDEMRHLRWVNEALILLGRPVVLDRAERIGRQFDRPFELAPLTPAQLDWFIDVERPSQTTSTDVDGMYVRLLAAVQRHPDQYEAPDRLVQLLKLIIDEGEDHFERFTAVKAQLAGLTPDQYLRPLDATPGDLDRGLLALSDQDYAMLLATLSATFSLSDRAGGALLEQSRRAMFSLHEVNHVLAGRGVAPPFTMPQSPTLPTPVADDFLAAVDERAAGVRAAGQAVADVGGTEEREMVLRHEAAQELMVASLRSALQP